MVEGYGIKLNMDREYDVLGQKVHFADFIPLNAQFYAADIMEGILFKKDPNSGTVKCDYLMVDPIIYYIMFDLLSDADLTEYKESENRFSKLYDDVCQEWGNGYDWDNMPNEIYGTLRSIFNEAKKEAIRVTEAEFSAGSVLRNITKYIGGDGTNRDIGLIRKMVTEFMMEMRKKAYAEEQERVQKEMGNMPDNVVDLSKYKPKTKE